jgi:hypothetical protein
MTNSAPPISIFISYAHIDEDYLDDLHKQLTILKQTYNISCWYDREIKPGVEWDAEIKRELQEASIILLLISTDFLTSTYCNDVELAISMKRHKEGTARVVPIILRDAFWKKSLFADLQALPKNAKPISTHSNIDTAFLEVAHGIEKVIKELSIRQPQLGSQADSNSSPGKGFKKTPAPTKVIRESEDKLQDALVCWARNIYSDEGITGEDLMPLGKRILQMDESLTLFGLSEYFQDEQFHESFRSVLLEEFPNNNTNWPIDWAVTLFLYLRSEEFSRVVPLKIISEAVRLKFRSHVLKFRQ